MTISLKTDYTTTTLVTQAQAEAQLRISSGFQSDLVLSILHSARQQVEKDTERSILNQVWTMKLNQFPDNIYLPRGVVSDVAFVKYIDTDGTEQTLVEDTDYTVALNGDEAVITPVSSWPSVHATKKQAVSIEYTAGYGTAPNKDTYWAVTAILALVEQNYHNVDMDKIYYSHTKNNKLYFNWSIND